MAQRGTSGACAARALALRARPSSASCPKSRGVQPSWCSPSPWLQHSSLCACILVVLGYAANFAYFLFFAGQQILLQLLQNAAADRVREHQCKLQGKAEDLRSPAVARISKLAFHSMLMNLVFLQIALIVDI